VVTVVDDKLPNVSSADAVRVCVVPLTLFTIKVKGFSPVAVIDME